jgi:ribulose-5-phosphate 4-epimerase/fuculose-1-phosphate aldolase
LASFASFPFLICNRDVAAVSCCDLSQRSLGRIRQAGLCCGPRAGSDLDERRRIVSDLGPHDALIMRNHGLLTCGATIQQAFNTMYQLELSCRSQVDAMAARA